MRFPDRLRNFLGLERQRDPDTGAWAMVKLPFLCDSCHVESACYGKDGVLLCTGCWQREHGDPATVQYGWNFHAVMSIYGPDGQLKESR